MAAANLIFISITLFIGVITMYFILVHALYMEASETKEYIAGAVFLGCFFILAYVVFMFLVLS